MQKNLDEVRISQTFLRGFINQLIPQLKKFQLNNKTVAIPVAMLEELNLERIMSEIPYDIKHD